MGDSFFQAGHSCSCCFLFFEGSGIGTPSAIPFPLFYLKKKKEKKKKKEATILHHSFYFLKGFFNEELENKPESVYWIHSKVR